MSDMTTFKPAQNKSTLPARLLLWLILGVFAIWFLLPAYVVVGTSLKGLEEIRGGSLLSLPHELNFWAWRHAWSEACIGVKCTGLEPYFWNSVAIALPSVALSTFLGALTGYSLTKWQFPGANLVFALILFGCFVPFQVVILPMAQTLGIIGITNTVYGLILVHTVYGLAFTTLFFRNYYVTIPDELVRAATIDGAGFFTIFRRIILPLSPPIIVVSVIWQFTQIWNDFLFGASFTTGGAQPIMVAMNNLVNTTTGVKQYNVDMAAALITAAPTILVYIVAGRYFVRGLTAGSVKG
ncbi:MAG: glucose/mannose transport system permease protein [Paracoccaceae bacterium]|jgi:glucose/mannose transport system permease protein